MIRQILVAAMLIFAAFTTVGAPMKHQPPALGVHIERLPGDEESLTVWRNGHVVVRLRGDAFERTRVRDGDSLRVQDLLVDVTGDGRVELVVSELTGGGHLSHVLHVIDLRSAETLARIPGGGPEIAHFDDVDGDGRLEFRTHDWAFSTGEGSVADSPAPEIILRLTEGGAQVAWDLMISTEPLTLAGEAFCPQNPVAPGPIRAAVVEGLYTGRAVKAWNLLDAHWTPGREAKQAFRGELMELLAASPYGRDLLR